MSVAPKYEPFVIPSGDPLAKEHKAVTKWVEDAYKHLGENNFYIDLELKTLPSGALLLAGDPEQSKKYVLAAARQVAYWDRIATAMRDWKEDGSGSSMFFYQSEEYSKVWGRRRQSASVMTSLMRRNLPWNPPDLLFLINWCCTEEHISNHSLPLGPLTRALERFSKTNSLDAELKGAIQRFASLLRASHDKDTKRLGTTIEQLCPDGAPEAPPKLAGPVQPAPQPSPGGAPAVLVSFKRFLGMLPEDTAHTTTNLEPDLFPLPVDSPLRVEHTLLTTLLQQFIGSPDQSSVELEQLDAGTEVLALSPLEMGRMILAAAERYIRLLLPSRTIERPPSSWQVFRALDSIINELMKRKFELDRDSVFDFLLVMDAFSSHVTKPLSEADSILIQSATKFAREAPLTEGERYILSLYRGSRIAGPSLGAPPEEVVALTELINDGAIFVLVPGEAWGDALNESLRKLDQDLKKKWIELLRHALTATGSRPSEKWLKTADRLIQAIGEETVRESMKLWFEQVSKGRTVPRIGQYPEDTRGSGDTFHEENALCLRGLLWMASRLTQPEKLARTIGTVALAAYKKVPGIGPRAVKVGNAAIYALSEMVSPETVGQLAMLKVRVKFGTAQKEIEKAYDFAASTLGLPRDQIEELGVPSYGLEEVGSLTESLGDFMAEIRVTGSHAELAWFDAKGKPLKSVPARVRKEHAEELKELQQSVKDIQSMLPAQRDRIDGLFMLQKSWPIGEWRTRYHDHPLVGTIARRLLWCVDGAPVLFEKDNPFDVQGKPVPVGPTTQVTLWHPIGREVEEIVAWRRRLEELQVTQPFKQAHREVYLLTDAELRTGTYSNRFAAHIIRQHQFNALCAARGWKNKLRLLVDAEYPPATKELPLWGLRAEFWIEGIGEDYGTDTNDSGAFLRLATDQVRFYRMDAVPNSAHAGGGGYGAIANRPGNNQISDPLPLDQVPPLVFSEIMRDVDLFVGVASVGNDPAWQDGGPEGRYRDYWQGYSFGDLSGTATTRKKVLESLVPRLKIAKRCSFSDRFLIVRGDKRTYKIHLGSGNILMEPNDQYLCIVPDSQARNAQGSLYLPFEGDAMLSIIISKALLLAEDTKIKDPTITRQIEK